MSQAGIGASGGGGGSGITTIVGDIGSVSGSSVTISGGTTGLVTDGSGSLMNIQGTLVVPNGGTGDTSFTAYSVITGGTTSTGALQNVSGVGTAGQALVSNGAGALPSWQSISDSSSIHTITGNSGGPESPSANNFNIVGTGSITTVGTAATQTIQLTGLVNHAVLLGQGTATINNLAPSATAGVAIVSQGATSDPHYGTVVVAGGGTGVTSISPYGVMCGGTTPTGAIQNAGTGTAGQFFVSNGSSALPSWQDSSTSGVFEWIVSAATSITAVPNTGYILTAGSLVTITLPDPATPGQQFGFMASGGTTWKITQDLFQQMQLATQATSVGTGGYLASSQTGDTIILVATDSAYFIASSVIGNIGWH